MAYQQKDGSGSLFKNDRKTEVKHPDYKGKFLLDGREYDLAAWIREAKESGQKYMSLKVERHQERTRSFPKMKPDDAPF